MFFNEDQVRYLTSKFMPRLKDSSVSAMIAVACHGHSILSTAQKYELTHQSLSKNLINLKELQGNIVTAKELFPSSHLFEETIRALLMANVSFPDASVLLIDMCEKLNGKVDSCNQGKEFKLFLDETVTTIYLNPNDSYDYAWDYNHSI